MPAVRIIVVEDERDIREVLIYNLSRQGYDAIGVDNGREAVGVIRREQPDLVLLDLMLPGLDGLEICRILKKDPETRMIPIIMVSAKGEENDIVTGLELGADDYITKPFSTRELLARVAAGLRRNRNETENSPNEILLRDGVTIDPIGHRIEIDGETTAFTLTEFKLLHFLAAHPGRVFTRDHLISRIRGEDNFVVDRNIDVHIQAVRKKLGRHRGLIETIRGIGYRFRDLRERG
ncbi:MAG: response regulator [Deltaproteobacteria bacterium]|nr:response regulator [Deltaproteobacteria bacterium]